MARATSASWKHLPAPIKTEPLGFEASFTPDEAERLMGGLVPEDMEDKWFVYFADGWLRFHRSWTGALIYCLRLENIEGGVRVTNSWVNREPSQYTEADTPYDRRLVRFLIDAFLLGKSATFPMPANDDSPPGVVQHAYVGRTDPEQHHNSPEGSGDA